MSSADVFVSTGSLGVAPSEAIRMLVGAGATHVELSAGSFDGQLSANLKAVEGLAKLQVHNYFPPANPPFVFNLASLDATLRNRTLACMREAIDLSVALGAARYSFHAGFLLDPPLKFLGASWTDVPQATYADAWETFSDSVSSLKEYADPLGIELLVENNVLTGATYRACGPDVLLMASGDQIESGMKRLPEGIGLLMDVAHLRVSARTLSFDSVEVLTRMNERTRGYHLSDNDGFVDSNDILHEDSWFWPHLDDGVPFATLELQKQPPGVIESQIGLVTERWSAFA